MSGCQEENWTSHRLSGALGWAGDCPRESVPGALAVLLASQVQLGLSNHMLPGWFGHS